MATLLANPTISGGITCTASDNNGGDVNTSANMNNSTATPLVVGGSAGQVNKAFEIVVTVVTGTPQLIDLTSITDIRGNSVSLSKLNCLRWTNLPVNAVGQNLTMFGGTNGVFGTTASPKVYAPGSSGQDDFGPLPVTIDSTHKIIQVAIASGTATILLSGVGQ